MITELSAPDSSIAVEAFELGGGSLTAQHGREGQEQVREQMGAGATGVAGNTLMLGGAAGAGEKGWGVMAVLLLFPLRVVAVWAFLKMRRWGYDFMVLTSWMYAITFFGYLVNVAQDFDVRFGAARFGALGWWAVFVWYLTPYVVLPWLYALNRTNWNR